MAEDRNAKTKDVSFKRIKRILIVHFLETGNGLTERELAKQLNVPTGRVRYYLRRLWKTGQVEYTAGRYHYQ